MKKRILSLTMALALMATLTGCVTNEESDPSSKRDDKSISDSSVKSDKENKSSKNSSSDIISNDESSTPSSDENDTISSEISEPDTEIIDVSNLEAIAEKYGFTTDNGRILLKSQLKEGNWPKLHENVYPYYTDSDGNSTLPYFESLEPRFQDKDGKITLEYCYRIIYNGNCHNLDLIWKDKDGNTILTISHEDPMFTKLLPGLTDDQLKAIYISYGNNMIGYPWSQQEMSVNDIYSTFGIDVSEFKDYVAMMNPDGNNSNFLKSYGIFTVNNEDEIRAVVDKLLAYKATLAENDNPSDDLFFIIQKANKVYFANLRLPADYDDLDRCPEDFDNFIAFCHIVNVDQNEGNIYSGNHSLTRTRDANAPYQYIKIKNLTIKCVLD